MYKIHIDNKVFHVAAPYVQARDAYIAARLLARIIGSAVSFEDCEEDRIIEEIDEGEKEGYNCMTLSQIELDLDIYGE